MGNNDFVNIRFDKGKTFRRKDSNETFTVYEGAISKTTLMKQFEELGCEWINFRVGFSQNTDKYYLKIKPNKKQEEKQEESIVRFTD